jgi:hypothetical protein
VAVEAREPATEAVKELGERRVNVEVVLAEDVIRGELIEEGKRQVGELLVS